MPTNAPIIVSNVSIKCLQCGIIALHMDILSNAIT